MASKYTGEELLGVKNNSTMSMSTFKWVVGILVAIMLALFTIPLYKQFEFETILHEIHIEQVRTSARLTAIEREMSDRHDTVQKLERQLQRHWDELP